MICIEKICSHTFLEILHSQAQKSITSSDFNWIIVAPMLKYQTVRTQVLDVLLDFCHQILWTFQHQRQILGRVWNLLKAYIQLKKLIHFKPTKFYSKLYLRVFMSKGQKAYLAWAINRTMQEITKYLSCRYMSNMEK